MHPRDMNSRQKFYLLLWGVVFFFCAINLGQVIGREFEMPASISVGLGLICVTLLTVSVLMIHKSRQRGFVENRTYLFISGGLLFLATWFVVFMFNTSNAYYWLAHRDAKEKDLALLSEAFEELDGKSKVAVNSAISKFQHMAGTSRQGIIDEIRSPANPGRGPITDKLLSTFNKDVGAAVNLPSISGGKFSGKTQQDAYIERVNDILLRAIAESELKLTSLRANVTALTSSEKVSGIRESIDKNIREGANDPERQDAILQVIREGFHVYAITRESVINAISSVSNIYLITPDFRPIPKTPFSTDLRTVARMLEPAYWGDSLRQPKFWMAMCVGLLLDLALVLLLIFFVLRED